MPWPITANALMANFLADELFKVVIDGLASCATLNKEIGKSARVHIRGEQPPVFGFSCPDVSPIPTEALSPSPETLTGAAARCTNCRFLIASCLPGSSRQPCAGLFSCLPPVAAKWNNFTV
jgi:hypothetical protein